MLFWSLFVLQVLIGRKVWEQPDTTVFIAGNVAFFSISVFATGLLTRHLAFRWLVVALCMIWMLMLGLAVR